MIILLKNTIFNANFWYGVVFASLAVVGYLYANGNKLQWKWGK